MTQLSLEALQWASLAVLRERAAAERALLHMDPETEEAHDLGDDVVQMIKVQSELYEAYTELQAVSEFAYPTWDELVAAATGG
jgi:hypothetical protein